MHSANNCNKPIFQRQGTGMRGRVECCTDISIKFTPTIPPSDTNGKTGNGSSIHFTEELRGETLLLSREILRLNSKPSIILI